MNLYDKNINYIDNLIFLIRHNSALNVNTSPHGHRIDLLTQAKEQALSPAS